MIAFEIKHGPAVGHKSDRIEQVSSGEDDPFRLGDVEFGPPQGAQAVIKIQVLSKAQHHSQKVQGHRGREDLAAGAEPLGPSETEATAKMRTFIR